MTDMCITKLSVAEAMSHEFGTVSEDIPVHIVIDLMLQNHWGEVLVFDENNRLIGLVTKERLVRSITDGTSDNLPIKSVCCNKVITTDKEEELVEARDVMRRHRIGRLPVLNHTGEVIGILTARDVCNGFSGKLEMLGEHMYSVMENIAEAIQVVNCNGIVTFWNYQAEKLFGIKASEITGRKLADFFSEDLLLKVITTLDSYQNVLCELNGIYVVRNAVPVISIDGKTIGAVCTSLNVNCYKNLLEQLDRA
ncbi:MAG: CBS domain-containing protein, partial [Syntrophomonadaceae bacterium]|nr:CBS domain-containing protein [Syntrophomonadaceae bacterium]